MHQCNCKKNKKNAKLIQKKKFVVAKTEEQLKVLFIL